MKWFPDATHQTHKSQYWSRYWLCARSSMTQVGVNRQHWVKLKWRIVEIPIPLKLVPKGLIVKQVLILVQVMDRRREGSCFVHLFTYDFLVITVLLRYTIRKRNGRIFSDTKPNMMPSLNLHDYLWLYEMPISGHFLCEIWLFALTRYAPGVKGDERIL